MNLRWADSGRPLESALATGVARARDTSVAAVAALLPGVDIEALARRGDGGDVVRAKPGPGVLRAAVGPDVVDRALAFHDLGAPRLRPMNGGVDQPYEHFAGRVANWAGATTRAKVGRLAAELTGGATVSIDGVDEMHPGVERLAEHIERVFVAKTLVNCYVSGGDQSATQHHWDDHDVIALQLEGRKRWQIRMPVEAAPLRGHVPDKSPGGDVCFDDVVEPGDVLYLPRGCPHVVTPVGDFSMHLTAGITRSRGVDVLRWLSHRGGTTETARRDLVRTDTDAEDQALEQHMAAELVAGSVGAYRRLTAALQRSRATTRFSTMRRVLFDQDWSGVTARLSLPGGFLVESAGQGVHTLAGAGRRWTVADHALGTLGHLLEAETVDVEDLSIDCPTGPSCARTFVAQLAVDGLVALNDRGRAWETT